MKAKRWAKIAFWPDKLARRAPPCMSIYLLMCSNLGSPLPTQNRPYGPICVAKRLFSVYFGHFFCSLWATFGTFWARQMSQLVSIYVLTGILNLFQHYLTKKWVTYGLIVKMQFVSFFGPWRAQICEIFGAQVETKVIAHSGTKNNYDTNRAL